MEPCTFQTQNRKIKKIYTGKISYTSGNGNPKTIFTFFSKVSCSYVSGKENPEKILYISGNGSPVKTSYISERYIQNPSTFRTRSIFKTPAYSEP